MAEKEPTKRSGFPSAPLQPIIPISQLSSGAGTTPFPGKTRILFLNIPKCYFQKWIKAVKHYDSPKTQGIRGRNLRHMALVGWESGCSWLLLDQAAFGLTAHRPSGIRPHIPSALLPFSQIFLRRKGRKGTCPIVQAVSHVMVFRGENLDLITHARIIPMSTF